MKLLLALLCIRSAQGFDFVQFAGNGQESGVLYATGFCIEVIETVWQKYSRRLIHAIYSHAAATDLEFEAGFGPLRGDPDKLEFEVALSLYAGLRYVHQYPTAEGIRDVHYGRSGRWFSKTRFYATAVKVMRKLANIINEVHYSDRLHYANHWIGLFANRFTTIVDCSPLYVRDPVDSFWSDLVWQKKYNGAVWKFQIGEWACTASTRINVRPHPHNL